MIGVDTPETVDPNTPDECFGAQASERAERLLAGESVRLATDPTQDLRDRYGRLLVYVYTDDGANYALETIRQGYGVEYTFDEAYQLQQEFRAAERQASSSRSGLWSADTCDGNADLPVVSEEAVEYTQTLYVNAAAVDPSFKSANFRAAPSQQADLVGEVSNGEQVRTASSTVSGAGGDRFYPARYGGSEGYILATLLSEYPPGEAEPAPPARGGCDPAYPGICIESSPPDLDCKDVPQHADFVVKDPDPHRFDGDNDGRGCESN